MFRFHDGQYLFMLFLLPILFVAALYFSKRTRKLIVRSFGEKLSPFLTASLSMRKRKLKLLLQTFVLALFLLAMARPQFGTKKEEVKSLGVEMMVAVDVSKSMLAEDIKPSRLYQAKRELNLLLDKLAGDKIGLLVFAGSAAIASPMTNDYSALRLFIDSLSVNSISTQGTNFKTAMEQAVSAFKVGDSEEEEGDSERATRVILLVSDGEDNEKGALDYAKAVIKKGFHFFTYAFGTPEGGSIPIRDDFGYLKGYKKNKNGSIIVSKTNTKFLKELAEVGKGGFYQASSAGGQAILIAEDIKKLEKAEFDSFMQVQYNEQFSSILFFAIALALIELLLGERKTKGRIWQGRFEVMDS